MAAVNELSPVLASAHALLEAMPELVLMMRRDGTVRDAGGGRAVPLKIEGSQLGRAIEEIWPVPVAEILHRLVKRAIATREPLEAEFIHDGARFEARVTAQAPDRALCVIRPQLRPSSQEDLRGPETLRATHLDRRGFQRRFKESMAMAALHERPLAVAVIHLDGLLEISRLLDPRVFEQVSSMALARLPQGHCTADASEVQWFIGQSENLLIAVMETADRDAIERCLATLCESLRQPIELRGAVFQLTPSVGVAILGQDASAPRTLLDHARATAVEARRAGSARVFFFSDTLKLRSLARLDIAQELREAIAQRRIRLRYTGRHELATGVRTAWVGYLSWQHPLRGEVRPAEFIGVAEATGLATALSQSLLETIAEDFARLQAASPSPVRLSFGALRHHVLKESFVAEIRGLLSRGGIPAEQLELRVSERAYIARDARVWQALRELGVSLVVDEFGRIVSSLELLSRASVSGLQLERAWVKRLPEEAAVRWCRAVLAVAGAFEITSIAAGVDDARARQALLSLGCREGSGDLYAGSFEPAHPGS